jgi:hypothetical protein
MAKYKTIIGRAETIDFPAQMLINIPAKTDTGAYLSAIHASDIQEIEKPNGKKILKFTLLKDHSSAEYARIVQVKSYTRKTVENSFGHKQERFVVKLKVKIGGKTFITDFGLADRSKKAFPILLGRTLINKRFIVDTDIAHIDHRALKIKLKDWLKKDDLNDSKDEA